MKGAWMILLAAAAPAFGQTKAGLAPPRDADKAARRVTASWEAWTKARPEDRLLVRKPAEALEEIDRSDRLARQYLERKRAYYDEVARAFQQEAALVAAPSWNDSYGQAQEAADADLGRIQQRIKALRKQMDRLKELPRDGQSEAVRLAGEKLLTTLDNLRKEAERRAKALAEAERTGQDNAAQREETAATLVKVAAALAGLAEAAAAEASDWGAYHDHLRALVKRHAGPAAIPDSTLGKELDDLLPPKTQKEPPK